MSLKSVSKSYSVSFSTCTLAPLAFEVDVIRLIPGIASRAVSILIAIPSSACLGSPLSYVIEMVTKRGSMLGNASLRISFMETKPSTIRLTMSKLAATEFCANQAIIPRELFPLFLLPFGLSPPSNGAPFRLFVIGLPSCLSFHHRQYFGIHQIAV